jgi:hypothetical protein
MLNAFYTKNNKEIKSAGIIFYSFYKGKLHLLLQNCKNKWSDFGGKKEKEDTAPYITAARETSEESNCMFVSYKSLLSKKDVIDNINKCTKYITKKIKKNISNPPVYIGRSKYMLYFVKISVFEMRQLKKRNFSEIEYFTNIHRKIEWIKFSDYKELLNQGKIHIRINNNNVLSQLEKLSSCMN